MVKRGESAQIDVGTKVPIITSRATASGLPGNGSSILQSVQRSRSGTILEIEPVIHSGSRVDLRVSQEVSEAALAGTSSIPLPGIFSRRPEDQSDLE